METLSPPGPAESPPRLARIPYGPLWWQLSSGEQALYLNSFRQLREREEKLPETSVS